MNQLELTKSDKIAMNKAGFSWKALETLSTHDFQKWIDNISVCHTKKSPKNESLQFCIKVDNKVIIDASCTYVGCPALAAIGATVTELIIGKPIEFAENLKTVDIWQAIESLPPDHEEHIDFAIEVLEETLDIFAKQKVLTKAEHEDYKHLCGLTGKEIEEIDVMDCESCSLVQNCENDHIILE